MKRENALVAGALVNIAGSRGSPGKNYGGGAAAYRRIFTLMHEGKAFCLLSSVHNVAMCETLRFRASSRIGPELHTDISEPLGMSM